MRGHIRKHRQNSWAIVVELPRGPDGKRRQQWTIVKGDRPEAERKLTAILNQLDKGGYQKPVRLTVAEYLRQWLKDYAEVNVRPRTYARYAEICEKRIIPALGTIKLTDLKPAQVQSFYSQALTKVKAITVYYYHRVLCEALRYGVRHEMIMRNVCEAVDAPKPKPRQLVTTGREGIGRLLEAVRNTKYYTLFYSAAYTGMRRSELLGLKWRNVDLDFATLYITETLQKLGKNNYVFWEPKSQRGKRSIDLPPSLAILLSEHKAQQQAFRKSKGLPSTEDDLVFCHPDGSPYNPGDVSRTFHQVAQSIGLDGLRFHDLRHAHASLMLQQGIPVKVISERLGHSSTAFTMDKYAHVLPGMQEQAAQKFDELMLPTTAGAKK